MFVSEPDTCSCSMTAHAVTSWTSEVGPGSGAAVTL